VLGNPIKHGTFAISYSREVLAKNASGSDMKNLTSASRGSITNSQTERSGTRGKKVETLKDKVKAITRRSSPVNLEQVIADLNPILRGFANYFRMANCTELFKDLAIWIRRRLRHKQLSDWKKPTRLHRRLRQLGYKGDFPKIRMRSWLSSRSPQASFAMPNAWLAEMGLYDLTSVATGVLPKIT
jgi:RNA-directed DNA polymerase